MLKVNDINVYYGSIHAIKGVSFEVQKGEIVTLIGANGAGKSTILNTVSGLLTSKTGDISRTVASLVSHLRTKENCDILKDEKRYYMIGENTKDGWVAEPWVEKRMSRE